MIETEVIADLDFVRAVLDSMVDWPPWEAWKQPEPAPITQEEFQAELRRQLARRA